MKTCILPAVLTLNPLGMKNKRRRGEKAEPPTTSLPGGGGHPEDKSASHCLMRDHRPQRQGQKRKKRKREKERNRFSDPEDWLLTQQRKVSRKPKTQQRATPALDTLASLAHPAPLLLAPHTLSRFFFFFFFPLGSQLQACGI